MLTVLSASVAASASNALPWAKVVSISISAVAAAVALTALWATLNARSRDETARLLERFEWGRGVSVAGYRCL